jgi:hypothetical protein
MKTTKRKTNEKKSGQRKLPPSRFLTVEEAMRIPGAVPTAQEKRALELLYDRALRSQGAMK